MGFLSAESFRGRSGRYRLSRNDSVIFSENMSSKTKDGTQRTCIRLRIGPSIIKEAGWQAGDRMDLLFDPCDRIGLLRAVESGGYALFKGSDSVYVTQATWYPGMPSIKTAGECGDVRVTSDGLMFVFPDETSFTENVRITGPAA